MANQYQKDPRSLAERFWEKVSKTATCWLWTAGSQKAGYGRFKVNGKLQGAHRVAYELTNGPIPAGLVLCHRCDNPQCVNPAHLFPGTHGDNARDAIQKGRRIVPTGSRRKKGCIGPNRQLTPERVQVVKTVIAQRGTKKLTQVAKELALPYTLIKDIYYGRGYC